MFVIPMILLTQLPHGIVGRPHKVHVNCHLSYFLAYVGELIFVRAAQMRETVQTG